MIVINDNVKNLTRSVNVYFSLYINTYITINLIIKKYKLFCNIYYLMSAVTEKKSFIYCSRKEIKKDIIIFDKFGY